MKPEIPAGLYGRIINAIDREERLALFKRRLILESSGWILSVCAFAWLAMKLFADLVSSGLAQYLSLLFTDFALVMNNAWDYSLGLLEATPTLSLAFTLATLLALVFYSAKLADAYTDFKKISARGGSALG